jgi:hypothetical protein
VLSRNACYVKNPDVILRGFEEWGHAFAYTPDDCEIHDLNTAAWFIVELCDGRPFQAIEAEYVETVGGKVGATKARQQFNRGFNALIERNIIQASD